MKLLAKSKHSYSLTSCCWYLTQGGYTQGCYTQERGGNQIYSWGPALFLLLFCFEAQLFAVAQICCSWCLGLQVVLSLAHIVLCLSFLLAPHFPGLWVGELQLTPMPCNLRFRNYEWWYKRGSHSLLFLPAYDLNLYPLGSWLSRSSDSFIIPSPSFHWGCSWSKPGFSLGEVELSSFLKSPMYI